MSSQPSSSGIPFPQSKSDRERHSPVHSNSQTLQVAQTGKAPDGKSNRDENPASHSLVASGGQMSPPSLAQEGASEQRRKTTYSNTASSISSSSSSSSVTKAGLPSIRNLLNSVHHDDQSPGLSGKDLASRFTLEHVRPVSPSSHQRRQTVEGALRTSGSSDPALQMGGPSSQSWDAKGSVRSMSPPKRPPLAPSAYAHSHYMQPTGPSNVYVANQRLEYSSQRPISTVRHSPPSPSRRSRGQQPHSAGTAGQEAIHSSSTGIRAQGGRWAGPPAPLILHPASSSMQAYDPSAAEDQTGGSLLAKRSIQAQKDLDSEEPPLSPAAIRRRHTVGAMDEGYAVGLHPSSDQGGGMIIDREAKDAQSTPRTFQPGSLASPISHIPLESPTTPTASNPMAHRKGQDARGVRRERSMMRLDREAPLPPPRVSSAVAVPLALRNDGSSAVPNHMYMQPSTQSTGSMPSLSSSISTASGGSDRARVHSMEGRFDNNSILSNQSHPPSAWHNHGAQAGARTMSGSDSFASPQSSVWHSRSSTLDSIETTSSMASNPSSNSLSHHSHHASRFVKSGDYPMQEAPTTPRHYRTDYNRDWRFPAQQQQQHESASRSPQHHGMQSSRTRHESLIRPASSGQLSQYGEPIIAGHMPPSPFANLSLASPSSHGGSSSADAIGNGHLQHQQQQHIRPRAQTMTFTERRIAPLPSHGVHAQTAMMHQSTQYPYTSHDASSIRSTSPKRSFSSQSVNSLPQRVSSMEIESHIAGQGMFEFQPARRRLSSSGSRPSTATSTSAGGPGGTVIVSGANVPIGSGAGAAKYECGWCGKRFSRPSSLKIHHHSHTGEKPFICNEPGCGRTFSVQSNLRRHQKSHTANLRKVSILGTPSDTHEGQDLHIGGNSGGGGGGMFGSRFETKSAVIPARSGGQVMQMGLSHSMSMPYVGAATGHHGQGGSGSNLRTFANNPIKSGIRPSSGDSHEFGDLRERKTSVSSSLAGDRTDEEEEYFDVENHDDPSFGGESHARNFSSTSINTATKRPFSSSTDTEMMQDIHEETSGSSHTSNSIVEDHPRPVTAGSVQTRFQDLLNPPRSAPSN